MKRYLYVHQILKLMINKKGTHWLLSLFIIFSGNIYAQVPNDECDFAHYINSVDDYCSEIDEFSNIGALADISITNPCFLNFTGSVWFSFVPKEPAVIIRVNPSSLSQPEIGVYSGNCSNLNLVGCTSSGGGNGVVQLTITDLVIGQVYYLSVDGSAVQQGSFQLCIDDFINTRPPESDCAEGVILCDKSPFYVESLVGTGNDNNELGSNDCINTEFASVWYKWTCDQSGTLEFTLTPNNYVPGLESDDLDFSVYRLDNGIEDCNNKSLVRCMASGANGTNNITDPFNTWQECNGPTGLLSSDTDLSEQPGCQAGNNNFARALDMLSGESYALIVNNFSQSGLGFSIEFGGTGTFLGPQADFAIDALDSFECDKTINFTNLSDSQTDPILSYQWNFGDGATPVFSDQEGPHDVIYDSFGEKTVALTIESTRGCSVTKIRDIDIAACCADTSSLSADAEAFDLICFDIPEGYIIAAGISGSPAYSYSIDVPNYQPNPIFNNLDIGEYTVTVIDRKGCTANVIVSIMEPEEIIANAGIDSLINFGEGLALDGSYSPFNLNLDVLWSPDDNIDCVNCLDPYVVPLGETTYQLLVTDENGCTDTDEVTIRVNIERPVYAPNIFSPNKDGNNDFFNLFAGPGASRIDHLYIFDRWGNRVYDGQNILLNEYNEGWDGIYKDQPLNPGVFTWLAKVRFIDDVVFSYSGDITIIR